MFCIIVFYCLLGDCLKMHLLLSSSSLLPNSSLDEEYSVALLCRPKADLRPCWTKEGHVACINWRTVPQKTQHGHVGSCWKTLIHVKYQEENQLTRKVCPLSFKAFGEFSFWIGFFNTVMPDITVQVYKGVKFNDYLSMSAGHVVMYLSLLQEALL